MVRIATRDSYRSAIRESRKLRNLSVAKLWAHLPKKGPRTPSATRAAGNQARGLRGLSYCSHVGDDLYRLKFCKA